jgi:hypothetical protein
MYGSPHISPTLLLFRTGDFLEGLCWFFLGCLALFVLFALIGWPGRVRQRRLANSTLFGQAYVHNVTAEFVNTSGPRYVRYDVTITPLSGAPYDASVSVLTSVVEMPALNVGRSFPIQIDPKDPKHFRFVKKNAS